MTARSTATSNTQQGVGLIEILVTLIILAIGFLASANMQVRGMKSNHESMQRSQALLSVMQIMDRMRNNPEGVANGHYNGKTTGTRVLPTCIATGCSSEQLASVDLFEWSSNYESLRGDPDFVPLLPGVGGSSPAVGSISQPVNGVYTLSLTWQGTTAGAAGVETLSVKFAP